MDIEKPDISEKISRLRENYLENLPHKIAEIEAMWQKFVHSTSEQLIVLKQLFHLVHTLTGSAGTFGAEEISTSARQLEDVLKTFLERGHLPSKLDYDLIEDHIKRIKIYLNS